MHFLDLNSKYNSNFAIEMENVVVEVASGNISKDQLKEILKTLI